MGSLSFAVLVEVYIFFNQPDNFQKHLIRQLIFSHETHHILYENINFFLRIPIYEAISPHLLLTAPFPWIPPFH